MSLSCECDYDYDDDDTPWFVWPPKDYTEYKKLRATRCCSENCNKRISFGDTVGRVRRTRRGTEWEDIRMIAYMDDPESVTLAPDYMCERCTDLYFSFMDLGFECVSPYEDMLKLASEYHETYQEVKHEQ